MPPSVNSGMRTIFDGSYTIKLNISDFIDAIDPRETPLLALLGWGSEAGTVSAGADSLAFPCISPTHTWLNDELIPASGTLTAGYTSGGGTLTVGTTQVNYIKATDQLMVDDTHYLVTSINAGAGTVAVSVLDGSSDADHANGATWRNLGTVRLDGEAFTSTYLSTDLSSTSNYTQIFHEAVSVSGTSEATEKYGITDEFDREFAKKFQEVVIRMEQAAHYGLANSLPAANATRTDVRRMGGLYSFIRADANANVTNAAGAQLTEIMLVNMLEDIWTDGGKPDLILVGAKQKRIISSFMTPYVRVDRNIDTAGVVIGQYESDFGTLDIALDRYMRPDDLVIVTKDMLGIGPLKGNGNDRSFFVTPVPVSGDSRQAAITGEYTMEVRNSTRAHGWIYGLSTTIS
jgi:hypothetical protein